MNQAVHRTNKSPRRSWLAPILAAAVLLFGLVFLVVLWDRGELALGPCTAGREGAAEGVDGATKELLETPNFEASSKAIGDLEAGVVDERLVATLQAVTEEHRICVDAFKEGHYFVPGVPDGPFIPDNYGNAGGLPNSHYYGRAVDVRRVNGKPVRGNGTDPDVLDVGELISGIPPQERPDQIIGPENWATTLGHPSEEGWILDEDQLKLHEDHIHIGYIRNAGTYNAR